MMEGIIISVVIPTLNRKTALEECLRSLEAQSYPKKNFEVVIVDDGSSDGTELSVKEFSSSTLTIRYYKQERSGPGVARNTGVEHAQGEIIAFIEDDVLAHEQWLMNAANYFISSEVVCIEGRTELQGSSEPVRVFDANEFLGFIPCNLFVKKDLFLKVRGYDPEYFDVSLGIYFREDADFGFKMLKHGFTVKKAEDVIVRHPILYRSPNDYFTHARRYYFDPLLYKKHPQEYRKYIEKKDVAGFVLHRPFHYLSLFYILDFLLILLAVSTGNVFLLSVSLGLLIIAHAGIRFRYERSLLPKIWKIHATIVFLILPWYYMCWFVRGCKTFRSWGSLI